MMRRDLNRRALGLLLPAMLSLGAVPALALEGDASAPIEIAADRLELDDQAGTAVYTGDVDMRQGSMKLTGQQVTISRTDQGDVSRIEATGNRAYIEQKPSPDAPLAKGWGRTIIYHTLERRVELINQAELHRGQDTFTGAKVDYFLDRRVVEATSNGESDGGQDQRVRMTLTPQQ
ncbi:lipopolysaccharide export system protein LptA [Onishia taeanensis]|uniref:Lipopolysaccharide export system protein LptA n=1 Tax=Onishia taeanensis TaxID=284577 RepID=A0A1G7R8Z0_9GAMM|nr:lipopolysaccharide transport periplasmic protein LptA [Halomonas taeanensis]MAX32640.1 lipopolysaccharide transport periplasmic protein LptA [Halomonadaceae bacterium]SDG07217.1 lipopolysaccharide export system protein LptA [Halomonas taeanensis]